MKPGEAGFGYMIKYEIPIKTRLDILNEQCGTTEIVGYSIDSQKKVMTIFTSKAIDESKLQKVQLSIE